MSRRQLGVLMPGARAVPPPRRHDEADEAADTGMQPRRRRALVAPSPYLTLTTESLHSETLVRARGELDISTVLPFREAAFAAIGQHPERLVLELSEVREIDSAGITSLVTIVRVAHLVNVPVGIIPSPMLRDLLDTTGLGEYMPLAAA
jgi:Anti-anti-sigma regulatory factor (antagonist of anti-sigma factor)